MTHGACAAVGLWGRRAFALGAECSAVVKTGLGTLVGECGQGVRVFRGVPFAAPPVGDLRFRAPAKALAWTGERDATRFGASAPQPREQGVTHSEDCLYLNLWAPQGKGPFPVYVWIHGGGFTGGHAFEPVYDGTMLAQQGVICITVGYRLGVLGFLDVEPMLGREYAGSANNGLRDLMAALSWVQAHVADFGGDPGRVTVGGESAGAKLTDILMGIPAARPLFSQMISESGGAERVWPHAVAQSIGSGFAEKWRASSGLTDRDLLTASSDLLLVAQEKMIAEWPQHFPLRPEIDGTLVPRLPIQAIDAGSCKGKRLLIGTNRDESALFVGPHPGHDASAAELGNMPQKEFVGIYAQYKRLYPEMTDDQLRIRALTAEEYWIPSVRVADAHVKAGGKAWMYRLDFAEARGRLANFAYHSLDVGLVWDKPHPGIGNDADESALAVTMQSAWASFIRGGAPVAAGLPEWPEYETGNRKTMILDVHSGVVDHPQKAELALWDGKL
ncbi:carboxylesterase/lipase family protein [Granulicella tundricola]|uniref:carboxylesterase/lipase family protein n=1 Tax=Granulicella tundricola TaxID=940615 RepID=UPI001E520132|nr:carboxylesterase/lipase family protein [Granulicella tundricola]